MVKLQIIGHLGKDCVVNDVNGKNVINFNVASTEKFKNQAGVMQERTTWVECAYWTDRTAIAPYLVRGQLVFVEGTPSAEAFKRQDGEPGASLRLRVRDVQLLGGKTDTSSQSSPQSYPDNQSAGQPADQESAADDLPF